MRSLTGPILALVIIAAAVPFAAAQTPTEEQQDLRSRIEAKYDVVPLSDGLALRPKVRTDRVRLIEVENGNILVDGATVTGGELRERVGSDADLIVRLSYLDEATRKALFEPQRPAVSAEEPATPSGPQSPVTATPERHQRSRGDRVRIMGNVEVPEDERIDGQAVAVLGSVRVDGEVADQVVAVLGSVELGPHAVVGGDIVSVGGRVRRDPGAVVRGGITEVGVGSGVNVGGPHWQGFPPLVFAFGPFGGMARLVGTTFHLLILALLASIAFLVARVTVERGADRVAQEPLKATVIGIISHILIVPVFVLAAVVLAITIVGIPLLLLLPFAALFLVLVALAGFSGSALAVGRLARRRFGKPADAPFVDLLIGVVVILLPILVGRVIGLVGWPVSPLVFLLIAVGVGIEYLAWASGFGAVLVNAFSRWQARRTAPPTPPAPESATV